MEKRLSVQLEKFVGNPLSVGGRWATAYAHEPISEEDRTSRGSIYVIVQILADSKFDAALAGKLVWDALSTEYYKTKEGPPLRALEKAVAIAERRLLDLVAGPKGIELKEGIDFNLAAATLWGQVLYLSQIGSTAVFLKREGKTKKVAAGGRDGAPLLASGILKDGDEVVLATKDVDSSNLEELSEAGQAALKLNIGLEMVPAEEEVVEFVEAPTPSFSARAILLKVKNRAKEVLNFLRKRFLTPGEIYIPQPKPLRAREKTSRAMQILIFALLALLVLSVTYTLRKRRTLMRETEVQKVLTLTERNISSAESLIDLNNIRARNLLKEAQENLERVQNFKIQKTDVEEALIRVQAVLDKVDKISRSQPTLLYDLKTQNENVSPTDLTSNPTALFVSDPQTSTVFQLNLTDPLTVERAAGGRIKSPQFLEFVDNHLYILGSDGFSVLDLSDSSLKEKALELPQDPSAYKDLTIYLGNIYLLTPQTSQVLKFVPTEEEFSRAISWIKETLDLSSAISLAVDGNVYILLSDGTLLKLAGGESEDFRLKNLDRPLDSPTAVSTTAESQRVYLLDSGNKRIVVVNKDGMYQAQYILAGDVKDLNQFFVDEGAKKIYLLSGTKVYFLTME